VDTVFASLTPVPASFGLEVWYKPFVRSLFREVPMAICEDRKLEPVLGGGGVLLEA